MAQVQGSVDDLVLDIEAKVCGYDVAELGELSQFLKVDITAQALKGRLQASKKLRGELDKLIDEHEESGDKESFVKSLWEFVCGQDKGPNEVAAVEKVKGDLEELQSKMTEMLSKYNQLYHEAEGKAKADVTGGVIGNHPVSSAITEAASPKSSSMPFRKEFKIVGSIGGEKEKDRLSFVGLMRQIDSGVSKDYPENEIIDAVIRAVHSSSKLKAYLEIVHDITLKKLRQIVRVHLQEKSATELYQELTTLTQEMKETHQDFLLKALSLRERVIFASKAEDEMKYDAPLVNSLFVHAFETGLRDEVIRNKVRPVLYKTGASDEELMEALNKIVSVESERQIKLGVRSKEKMSVSSINTGDDSHNKPETKQNKQPNLVNTVQELQIQLAELNAKFNASRAGERATRPRRAGKCRSCEEKNTLHCDHCFKCGSNEHFARGCKSSKSGNDGTLRPRDRK